MFKKKKEERLRNEELQKNGLYLDDIYLLKRKNRALLCVIRGLLVFMAVFSTIGAVVSSFNLEFNILMVASAFLVLAMLSAFVYYNRVTFYMGYAFLFILLIIMAFMGYIYINSGFQALLNEVRTEYTVFFSLPAGRESVEQIENRYLSVSIMMIFVGAVFSIFFNITISGYMDLPTTFLVSFVPLLIPFYIDKTPKIHYLIMLLSVYISVLLLSRSGHFTLPYRYKKEMPFERKRKKEGKKVREIRYYRASSSGMLQMFLYSIILSSLFLLITGGVFKEDFSTKNVSNPVKDSADEYVKMIASGGITSLFNRYEAKGGLSKGRIGGIRSVSPDFETDLIARFIPEEGKSVYYLKGYTGVYYNNNTFQDTLREGLYNGDILREEDYLFPYITYVSTDENADLPYLKESEASYSYSFNSGDGTALSYILMSLDDFKKEIFIENVDADEEYIYKPYYTVSNEIEEQDDSEGKTLYKKYSGDYITRESLSEAMGGNAMLFPALKYTHFVKTAYLYYPENLKDTLEEISKEAGLSYGMDVNTAVSRLDYYFKENYKYSLTPGAAPFDEDPVLYFLTTQKRGYCVHFAVSTALILRYNGIPTRYAEGYIIRANDIKRQTEDGYFEAEIPDANAHAWIEAYDESFGWVPYDTTPPSDDSEGIYEGLDFSRFFRGIMITTERNGEKDDIIKNNEEEKSETSGKNSVSYLLLPFIWMIGFIIICFIVYIIIKLLYFLIRLSYYERKERFDLSISLLNSLLIKVIALRSKNRGSTPSLSIRDEEKYIYKKELFDSDMIYKALYKKGGVNWDEYLKVKRDILKLIRDYLIYAEFKKSDLASFKEK